MKSKESSQHHEQVALQGLKRAFLVGCYRSKEERAACEEHLSELERLCDTYGLEVVHKHPVSLRRMDAGTLLGKGKIAELQQEMERLEAEVVIFDDELSPKQQRNLEKLFQRPVIDRTELIIEVFAQRAQTREACLQIELAKARYQLPRLRRLWTHLSRQVGVGGGGGAYLKGEGEKQIELDRRALRRRIDQLQKSLEEVKKQRSTQRNARLRTQTPTFAIVGYTNAGKSTLLRALTKADVLVEDKLFATLDTTTRRYALPNHQKILLIDTVGFIRKLPHTVVAAFKSTLEEAVYTDVILHVVDASHPQAEEQAAVTEQVLAELGVADRPVIHVLNKIDLCRDSSVVKRLQLKLSKSVPVSALQKSGLDQLLQRMEEEVNSLRKQLRLRIPQSRYQLIHQIMKEGRVISLEYEDNDVLLEIEIPGVLEHKVAPYVL